MNSLPPSIRKVLIPAVLLIAGIAGIMAWRHSRNHAASSRIAPHEGSLQVELQSLTMRRQGGRAQLVITALWKQSGQSVVRLEAPLVVLRPANGTPVDSYLGPFLPEAVLSGRDPAIVALSWWIKAEDLAGAVFLEVSGQTLPVKSKTAFDFPALPENQTVPVSFPDWKMIANSDSR